MDSAFGSVDTYRVLVSSGDYLAIQLSFDRSENYYVIRKVLFDEEIPSDKKKAIAMYDAYIEFYQTSIKEPMSDFDKEVAVHDYLIKNCVYGFRRNSRMHMMPMVSLYLIKQYVMVMRKRFLC